MTKSRQLKHHRGQAPKSEERLPFIEHLYELRHRLVRIAASLVVFSAAGYFIQQQLVRFLLKPSHGQQFIYTSPLGGINFLFQVCIYFGLVLSIPTIVFQLLKYLEPLLHNTSRGLVIKYSIISGFLAAAGGAFGYYMGLPIALRFLSHQFITAQIRPLLTIQEYMSFVTIYLLGSALLFQLPLIILFINRLKPLKPRQLLSFERYMVLIAFVAAAIMTPTTDIFDQLVFAVPIMAMYQIALLLIYFQNRRLRRRRSPEILQMLERDAKARAERQRPVATPNPVPAPRPVATATQLAPKPLAQARGHLPPDDVRHRMRFGAT
jgi:sec-independent protein translocase protein TatC